MGQLAWDRGKRVSVRKDDAILSVDVDITIGNLDALHVLAGANVGDARGLISEQILGDPV